LAGCDLETQVATEEWHHVILKAISYLGRIEKQLGVPVTTRNWNTIEKVVKMLRDAGCG